MLLLLVLEVLQRGLHLQPLLQVVEGRVLQPAVADKVVELVPRLDNIQIKGVIEPNYILLLEDADIAINIQVLQVLLPHIEAYHAHNVAQYLLESCALPIVFICPVKRALDDNRVKVSENFILFENHRACPRAVIDGKVEDPLVRSSLPHITQKLLQVFLVLQYIFVKVSHFSDADNLAALLQKD